MKCENCGKNEVTFVYRSNINGHVTEKHLCSECAEKEGYAKQMQVSGRSLMQDFFNDDFFGRPLFGDVFAPHRSLLGRMLENPFDDFFAEMPALQAAPIQQERVQEAKQQQEDLVSKEEQSRFSRMRKLNALRLEMKRAAREENFERAAQLRDEIRALEENKESA